MRFEATVEDSRLWLFRPHLGTVNPSSIPTDWRKRWLSGPMSAFSATPIPHGRSPTEWAACCPRSMAGCASIGRVSRSEIDRLATAFGSGNRSSEPSRSTRSASRSRIGPARLDSRSLNRSCGLRANRSRDSDPPMVSDEAYPLNGKARHERFIVERDEFSRKLKTMSVELATHSSQSTLDPSFARCLRRSKRPAARTTPRLCFCPRPSTRRDRAATSSPASTRALRAVAAAADRFAAGTLDGGFHRFFQEAGFQYAGSVSFTAATKWVRDYERMHEGKKITLGPHLKLGTGGSDTCLRIYWWIDEEARKLVIGHVGKHLTGARSG